MDFENLLKTLTEAHGISGSEAPIRALVRAYLQETGELSQDKAGSVICKRAGRSESPRVMLAAHMDEIGFMVRHITKDGFLRFLPVGGWFDQVLLGQRVIVKSGKGDVVGVIGAKPPHLLPADERGKVVKKEHMYIDVGATSQAEVEAMGIRLGDAVVPRADFVPLANGKTYLAKAFDDRVGVALMIAALQALHDHPNTVYGVATVMEEVGVRGATTSVRAVDPDVAIVLESDIAGDVPGMSPEESGVRLGGGPSMLFYDPRMLPNPQLRQLVLDVAADYGIPVQHSHIPAGSTDGSVIHLHGLGVPTVVLAVPARHIHSHSSIIHRDDFEQAWQLLVHLLQRLDAPTVAALTA
ncbi:MAG: M42 family metallopeptidase [Anaerolineales bacterium]